MIVSNKEREKGEERQGVCVEGGGGERERERGREGKRERERERKRTTVYACIT